MTTQRFEAAMQAVELVPMYRDAAYYLKRSGYAQSLCEAYLDNDDVMALYYEFMSRIYDWQAFLWALESAASEGTVPPEGLRRYAASVGCGDADFDAASIRPWIVDHFGADMETKSPVGAWIEIDGVRVTRHKGEISVLVEGTPVRVPPCDAEVLDFLLDYVEAEC